MEGMHDEDGRGTAAMRLDGHRSLVFRLDCLGGRRQRPSVLRRDVTYTPTQEGGECL